MKELFRSDRSATLAIVCAALVFPVVYLIRELAIAGTLGLPLDDSWIHLVYARNIARGDFFSYNPHEHVAGSTAPLWTILLGIGYTVSHSAVVMPKVIGVFFHVSMGVFVWRFMELVRVPRLAAMITGVAATMATRLVWASLSGMEVSMYTTMAVASMYWYVRYLHDPSWRRYLGWAVGGLSVAARPELMLTAVMFIAHQILIRIQESRLRSRAPRKGPRGAGNSATALRVGDLAARLAVFGVCAIPFFAVNLLVSGDLLPSTFAAKTAGGGASALIAESDYGEIIQRFLMGLGVVNLNAFKWLWVQDNLFLAIAAIAGIAALVITAIRKPTIDVRTSVLLLFALTIVFVPPLRAVVTGKLDFGQWGRYMAQCTPVMIMLGSLSICMASERLSRSAAGARAALAGMAALGTLMLAIAYGLRRVLGHGHQWPSMDWLSPAFHQGEPVHVLAFAALAFAAAVVGIRMLRANNAEVIVPVVLLAQCLAFSIVENVQTMDEYAWNVKNINDTQVVLGEWIHANVPAGQSYATNDIGAMAFIADGVPLIDLAGLVTPAVAQRMQETQSMDRSAMWVVQHYHPAFVICFNEWYPLFVREGVHSGVLEHVHAVPIPNNITCGGKGITAMHVYAVHPQNLDKLPAAVAP